MAGSCGILHIQGSESFSRNHILRILTRPPLTRSSKGDRTFAASRTTHSTFASRGFAALCRYALHTTKFETIFKRVTNDSEYANTTYSSLPSNRFYWTSRSIHKMARRKERVKKRGYREHPQLGLPCSTPRSEGEFICIRSRPQHAVFTAGSGGRGARGRGQWEGEGGVGGGGGRGRGLGEGG